jgi:hypothetical protein
MSRAIDLQVRGAWLFVVVLFALGASGLVTAMAHRPGSDSRSELTWAADEAVRPLLDTAVVDIGRLADVYEELGQHGRAAVAALISGDGTRLATEVDQGQRLVEDITVAVTRVRTRLRTIPGFGPFQERYFSAVTIQRWNDVNFALDQTAGVDAGWTALARGSQDAVRLLFLLDQHDQYVAAAAQAGTQAKYQEAIGLLDLAVPPMADLRALQNSLAARVDVVLLTELLDRSADLDAALRTLYTLLVESQGKTTDAITAAIATVDAARKALPADSRAITVVLSDIARSGPNEAVIRIEQARGRLLEALRLLTPEESDQSSGSGDEPAPEPSPEPSAS